MYKYVFIDLDDTIWDFHANAKLSLHDMFIDRELGRYFENFEEFFRIYAKRNIELWEAYGRNYQRISYVRTFQVSIGKNGG